MSSLLTFVPVFFSELNPTPPLFSFSLCFSAFKQFFFILKMKKQTFTYLVLELSFALNFLIAKAPTNMGCIYCFSFFTTPLHTPCKYAFCCFYSFLLKVTGCLLNKWMPLPLFLLSTASLQHFTPFTETFLIPFSHHLCDVVTCHFYETSHHSLSLSPRYQVSMFNTF